MITDEMVDKAARAAFDVEWGNGSYDAPKTSEFERETYKIQMRAAIEAVAPAIRNAALEEAATRADKFAAQNAKSAAAARKRASFGYDPFGHDERSSIAADELDACKNEAEALAADLRALKTREPS